MSKNKNEEQVMEETVVEVEEVTEAAEPVETKEEIKEKKVKWLDRPIQAATPREALKNGLKAIGKGAIAVGTIAGAVVVGMFVQRSRDTADEWESDTDYDDYDSYGDTEVSDETTSDE